MSAPLPTDLTESETRRLLRAAGVKAEVPIADDASPVVIDLVADLADIVLLYPVEEAQSRRLFLLCVKRDLLDLILGDYWTAFATQYGDQKEQSDQQFTHLRALRSDCVDDIETLREQLGSVGGYAHGDMLAQTPIAPEPWRPNPSDRAFGGDPLRRTSPLGGDGLRY